ncbi:hypothetical protein ACFLSQ_06685 [Bacteroidota bacterium]
MKTKQKKFDSVKLMRNIREKLTERFLQDHDLEMKDLEKIRIKYNLYTKTEKEETVYSS